MQSIEPKMELLLVICLVGLAGAASNVTRPRGIDCNFDNNVNGGTCSWRNNQRDTFDWKRYSGQTSSSGTGPGGDHTTGKGYYMYIETSAPRRAGDFAELQSGPLEDSCHDRCFDFYYNMYGSSMGSLSVSLRSNGTDLLLWRLSGNQGQGWKPGHVKITGRAPKNAEIIFTGKYGTSYKSDVAIDDIILVKRSNCSIYPAKASPRPVVTTRRPIVTTRRPVVTTRRPVVTTRSPVGSPVDCDFESSGMCKWKDLSNDKFDWTRNRGSTGSTGTGPSSDHTKGNSNGYYLYIETSAPRQRGDNAVLKSPVISGSQCGYLEFYYHMYGTFINQLNVSVVDMYGSKIGVWSKSGQQGNMWQKARIPKSIPISRNFSFLMEGIAGSSYTGDIAIDDIKFVTEACGTAPPPPPTVPVCSDYDVSCPSLARLCNSSVLSSCVRPQCPKTCGLCKKVTPAPPTPAPPTPVPGSCGISPVPHSRVIGGKDAAVGAWPWQAALRRASSGSFFCGGSLINNQWILTAAHCIGSSSPSYYKITLGDHNRQSSEGTEKDFSVSKVFKHPNYHQGASYNNDAALLKLSRPVLVSKRISPVCLPTASEVVPVGTNCYITGWGKIRHPGSSHNILQQALMPIRGKQECADRLAKSPSGSRLKITDQMVCAGYTGSSTIVSGCHGDSGGPLVCQKPTGEFQLHGAVSWGSPRCKVQERFTVFARVTAIRDWIDRTVAQN